MKIPIFEELILKDLSLDCFVEVTIQKNIGKVPYYINLKQHKPEDYAQLLSDLENYFILSNLSPRFPYPVYLLLNEKINHFFPNETDVKNLPQHYFRKVRRPNIKEIHLLQKLFVKIERVHNLNLNQIKDEIDQQRNNHKKLYTQAKKISILESIINALLHQKV